MLNRIVWVVIALGPAVLLVLAGAFGDQLVAVPLSALPNSPITIWLFKWWWLALITVLLVHQVAFTAYPFATRTPTNLVARASWAAANFFASPIAVPLYLWFCTNHLRTTHNHRPHLVERA